MVVMGIGGKPSNLLHTDNILQDEILVVKRFSGGGTVVMDHNSVWTTIIGRTSDLPDVEPYPRSIMEWSADTIFGPTFDKLNTRIVNEENSNTSNNNNNRNNNNKVKTKKTLVMDTKSCSPTENLCKVIEIPINKEGQETATTTEPLGRPPTFSLRENDYVLNGEHKMGGNAQSIIKGGWLHHTSFLWDYHQENMDRYLLLPEKRPQYRNGRSHTDFLVPLSRYYGPSYRPFLSCLKETCEEGSSSSSSGLEIAHLPTVLREVIHEPFGGMDGWFAKNRTKIVHDL
jgi:lipoate-protein ligase A